MSEPTSVHQAFLQSAARWPNRPFLDVLPETAAIYGIPAGPITYAQAKTEVARRAEAYKTANYGAGHRIGLLLENRPEFVLQWLALNVNGISAVPINPDLRAAELEYLLTHSEVALIVAIPTRHEAIRAAAKHSIPVIAPNNPIPQALTPGGPPPNTPSAEAALLYTSGTTGLPKGCVVSQTWFLECGRWYARMGGLGTLHPGNDRLLTPLPAFHMNAMASSFMAMMLAGGCHILLDRFHPTTWWDSVARARATIVHCLGVMPAMLMSLPETPAERAHSVRFAFCPGTDRRLQAAAETRFAIPLIDAWAMTETGAGAVISNQHPSRRIGENCFGRVEDFMQARIVADDGSDSDQGELLVRHTGNDPGHGFFTEYLKDPEATAAAWQGGWFHTGDIVRRNADGDMFFIDRKKNVIRRSGENIAAVEVEGVLQQHPAIRAVAVAAVPDEIRGDEVLACIVLEATAAKTPETAHQIVAWCMTQLAYYKAPGYIAFVNELPLTSTNKIQRGTLKTLALDLQPSAIDTRAMKRRQV